MGRWRRAARKLQHVFDQQREFYELPGAAAALVIPGMGTWSGGSGVADRQTGARVTAPTTFAIASITKAFVGAPALKLAREPLSARSFSFARERA